MSSLNPPKSQSPWTPLLEAHRPALEPYEKLYKHFHTHPELSNQEKETAKTVATHLRDLSPDLEVKADIGGHGLIAILRNGPGKTVLLRADFDALPIKERTGLEYASEVVMQDVTGQSQPVMHACGHDFHTTALLAAAQSLLSSRSAWSGTLIFLFQPAEERGTGANAMVDAGLYDPSFINCPIPDVCLGQHVFPMLAGTVGTKHGVVMTAASSMKITIFGQGGHGSMPHLCIDPVVIAAGIVIKLQTIVARELPPSEVGVVTVGAIQAGSTENVIADEAVLKVDMRAISEETRGKILASIERIVRAECVAGRCPKEPVFEKTREFPVTANDAGIADKVRESFDQYFGDRHDDNVAMNMASEDFGVLASSVGKPAMFWFFGGYSEERMKSKEGVPNNHSPFFAPDIQPTLQTGIDALVVAALTFVGKAWDRLM